MRQGNPQDSLLPSNEKAELLTIGCLLLNSQGFDLAYPRLQPEHFYKDAHRTIFEAMVALHEHREFINETSVAARIRELRGEQAMIDCGRALSGALNLIADRPFYEQDQIIAQVLSHVSIVERMYAARTMIAGWTDAVANAYAGRLDEAQQIAEEIGYQLRMQATRSQLTATRDLAESFMAVLDVLSQQRGGLTGVATGFNDLDRLTGGLQRSDLIILAARPSIGKTSLAMNLARNAGKTGKCVAIFSLEMSKEQLFRRLVANQAHVDQERLKTGWIDDEEWERIITAMRELSEMSIYIDDTAAISCEEIMGKAKNLIASGVVIDEIIIDYIQLMSSNRSSQNVKRNREQEVSEISRNLKGLARELNIPVVALAQLSRAVESRQSKIPQLSDLRESGGIENDADIVMFIYRDEVYNPETERRNIADLIIAKHRNGPVGEVSLYFNKAHNSFSDLEVSPAAEED